MEVITMASIEYLQDRIAKAEETIAKKENTISKKDIQIQKKMDKLAKLGFTYEDKLVYMNELEDLGFDRDTAHEIYWLECDIEHLEDDIQRGLKEINEKQKSLEEYKQKLQSEIEKANSRNIPVIIEFLEMWKEHVTEYYHNAFEQFLIEREEWYKYSSEHTDWWNRYGYDTRRNDPEEYKRIEREYDNKRDAYNRKWNFMFEFVDSGYGDTFNDERLKKILDEEANAKYDFIIERTNAIVGTITDASNLRIGAKGDLNGTIIGDRGVASVQTVGAGGWNIQCYHHRTLINRVK
jgi:hypothetical protein